MIDTKYFEEQICDELHGAKCYAKLAIECKVEHPEWAKTFLEMSSAELEHASYLMKMFNDFYAKYKARNTVMPSYIEEAHSEMTDKYSSKFAKVKYLHDAFNKL